MKYLNTQIGFREFPDEISLLINITGCCIKCPGCHSPELWEDIGYELNINEIVRLIESNKGITCIGFMGGNSKDLSTLVSWTKRFYPSLKIGWYWGGKSIPENLDIKNFNYIKIGPYIEEFGGLDNPNTNQKFYYIENGKLIDWTYKFWNNEKS